METVVVTGQYKPQSVKNSVYQVKVISRDQILATGAVQIQQVLSTQLGFRFSNDNTLGVSDVELMGVKGRNIKILLDGVPMTDRGDTRESLSQVDINTIERIEIIEGPMSVSYGSDALAGVINIITRKTGKKPISIFAKIQEETAANEYHPFNYKGIHMQNLGMTLNRKNWSLMLNGTHNESAGFGGDIYGRNKKWKPKEQWFGSAKISFTGRRLSIYYRFDALDESIIGRGAINTDTYKAIDKKYQTDRFLHQLQSALAINNNIQVNGLLSYTDYSRLTTTTRHDFEKNTDELTTGEGEQDHSKFNSLVFRATVQYNLSDKISFQPGVEFNRDEATGARIKGSPVINDYAFFISSEIKANNWLSVRPGFRMIENSVYDAPPVIPSINSKFKLNKSADIRLAYAYGFRAPALRELYFEFHDTNHDIIGNPDLEAEFSNSFTGSFNLESVRNENIKLNSAISAFYNSFRNQINYALNPSVANQYIYVNIDKFRTTGFSLENKLEWKDLAASLGFSHIGRYNRYSEEFTGASLPTFTWSPEINSGIIYTKKKIGASLGVFYKYTGKRPGYQIILNNAGEEEAVGTQLSSFHWADITFTKNLFRYFVATAGIKNLFGVTDIRNSSTVSGVHTGISVMPVGYGRSYFLGIAFQWDRK